MKQKQKQKTEMKHFLFWVALNLNLSKKNTSLESRKDNWPRVILQFGEYYIIIDTFGDVYLFHKYLWISSFCSIPWEQRLVSHHVLHMQFWNFLLDKGGKKTLLHLFSSIISSSTFKLRIRNASYSFLVALCQWLFCSHGYREAETNWSSVRESQQI